MGLNMEKIGDVLGVVGGATTGAALAIEAQSGDGIGGFAEGLFPPLSLDLGTLALGAGAGFAIAKYGTKTSPIAGAALGAAGAAILRPMAG